VEYIGDYLKRMKGDGDVRVEVFRLLQAAVLLPLPVKEGKAETLS
jgi:hypothetical protein